MISVGDLKDQYQQMISGGAKITAFDENSDSPLKDCLPKVTPLTCLTCLKA